MNQERQESAGTRKAAAGDDGLKFDTDFYPSAWLRSKREKKKSRKK